MILLEDIQGARERISEITYVTPMLNSEQLSHICRNQIFLKSEQLQKTGFFKIRGATNKVIQTIQE